MAETSDVLHYVIYGDNLGSFENVSQEVRVSLTKSLKNTFCLKDPIVLFEVDYLYFLHRVIFFTNDVVYFFSHFITNVTLCNIK